MIVKAIDGSEIDLDVVCSSLLSRLISDVADEYNLTLPGAAMLLASGLEDEDFRAGVVDDLGSFFEDYLTDHFVCVHRLLKENT